LRSRNGKASMRRSGKHHRLGGTQTRTCVLADLAKLLALPDTAVDVIRMEAYPAATAARRRHVAAYSALLFARRSVRRARTAHARACSLLGA